MSLFGFIHNYSPLFEAIADSILLLVMTLPMIYVLFYRPLKIQVAKKIKAEQTIANLNFSQELLRLETKKAKQEKEHIFGVYRDVIYSVTQGKLELNSPNEIGSCQCFNQIIKTAKIERPEDIIEARNLVKRVWVEHKNKNDKLNKILLAVSEGATNAIKHARCGGIRIAVNDQKFTVIIEDKGSGMDFAKLPHMIFIKGFSTSKSLGWGFSLIYNCCDRIQLCTKEEGTTLILEFLMDREAIN